MRLYTHQEIQSDIEQTEGPKYDAPQEFNDVLFLKPYSEYYSPLPGEARVRDLQIRINEFYALHDNILLPCDQTPDFSKLFNLYASVQNPQSFNEFVNMKLTLVASTSNEQEIKTGVDRVMTSETWQTMALVTTADMKVLYQQAPTRSLH